MAYILSSLARPKPLEDVIGLVDDEDGLTRMLVFMHPDGRWLVSQCERDVEMNVIAWAQMAPIPTEFLLEVA